MPETPKRSVFTIPPPEKFWLHELAARNGLSEAQVVRLLIRQAAKKVGLPDHGQAISAPVAATGQD